MDIELINTGSELLLGRVLNTHQQWIGRRLADRGYEIQRQVAVPDTGDAIRAAVAEACQRVELVITTGGLGPTSDDRTRDLIAAMFDRTLHEDPKLVRHIAGFFERRGREMPESVKVQALVPEGAEVIKNEFGTAPGLILRYPLEGAAEQRGTLVMLPGPPRELRPMFDHQVMPWLESEVLATAGFSCRTLRSVGLGESRVEEQLTPSLEPWLRQGLEIGYCARSGEVDIRLVARGTQAEDLVARAAEVVRRLLERHIYGEDDVKLEEVIVDALSRSGKSLSVAESCTGGFLAHRLTNVPGASKVLKGGFVTYSNEEKTRVLGVNKDTLATHGAVSESTAKEMAAGALRAAGTDFAVSITGVAGPGGGSPEKPVGTVFIGVADRDGTQVLRCFHPVERETFKYMTTQQALELLRRVHLKSVHGFRAASS